MVESLGPLDEMNIGDKRLDGLCMVISLFQNFDRSSLWGVSERIMKEDKSKFLDKVRKEITKLLCCRNTTTQSIHPIHHQNIQSLRFEETCVSESVERRPVTAVLMEQWQMGESGMMGLEEQSMEVVSRMVPMLAFYF